MSWINWSKKSKICKRCGIETMNYPCIDCGFDPVQFAKEMEMLKQ